MRFELKPMGIDTSDESIAFLSARHLALGGFHPLDRIEIATRERRVLAVLQVTLGDTLPEGVIALSDSAFENLGADEGTEVDVKPADPPASTDALRAKMRGARLRPADMRAIIADAVAGRLSKIELAAFVVASTIHGLSDNEILALIASMVDTGERLRFDAAVVADKHSIGGVPGNRTTPIVTAIVASAGVTMPKTSSRAVTSPAGTADTMGTLMEVALSPARIGEVVEATNACLAWGGALHLAPADDLLIRIEHPLHVDSESLMLASILAKKVAVGATHVLVDIPFGAGTKAETSRRADHLRARFVTLGDHLGLHVRVVLTDGSRPIGRGIGPVLEARDVLAVLHRSAAAPPELEAKSILLAGELLELVGVDPIGEGRAHATRILESGDAARRFDAIRRAQGSRTPPGPGPFTSEIVARESGVVRGIDNRCVSRIARYAGTPRDIGAGIDLLKDVGETVHVGEVVARIHAEARAGLGFAEKYARENPGLFTIRP